MEDHRHYFIFCALGSLGAAYTLAIHAVVHEAHKLEYLNGTHPHGYIVHNLDMGHAIRYVSKVM